MEEQRKSVPFECRGCWHVWEEDYLVRSADDRHGNEKQVWLVAGVPVPPPSTYAVCPQCGGGQITTFPEGYLARHPEARLAASPTAIAEAALLSPVPPRPIV
ncbi:hypothetical protein [Nonomuraea typhae]|uniref:hypothetical protein n=1 Tax=Nonomuraea typhae TaxID=2603600 RepID=UPI0012FA7100|nr:hypothetical protein [Nonomuraea typhae]